VKIKIILTISKTIKRAHRKLIIKMELLRTKSIESLNEKAKGENNENPNPYIRRFGSHIKSHFSQSRCEIFDSSDDEQGSLKNQVGTQMNSMNSMGSMRVEFNRPGEQNKSSLQNLDSLRRKDQIKHSSYRMGSSNHIKNSPSIDHGTSSLMPSNKFKTENTNQFKLDIETPENEYQGQLIINKSRKSSVDSIKSEDFDTNNLIEPGTEQLLLLQQEMKNENPNKIIEEVNTLEKREDFSQNSTANNSMFREGSEKIEEEVQTKEDKEGQLDIEN